METIYFARKGQTLRAHSEAVAKNTAHKCADFGFADLGYATGLLHDLGKYQKTFQKRLDDNSIKIDHAHCGSIYCKEQYDKCIKDRNLWGAIYWLIAQYCIAGHHTGLPNCGTVAGCQPGTLFHKNSKPYEDFSYFKTDLEDLLSEIKAEMKQIQCTDKDLFNMRLSMLIRMVFSALKDSDIESAIEGTNDFLESKTYADNSKLFSEFIFKLQTYIAGKK